MNIAVTGASGFIGRTLVERLVRSGHEVRAVHRTAPGSESRLEGADHVVADLVDPEACRDICRDMEEIYHLAAVTGGSGFQSSERLSGLLNVVPSTQIVRAASELGVRRVLFAGSCMLGVDDVFGVRDSGDTRFSPVPSGYMTEKFFSEQLWHAMDAAGEIETRVARLNHVYGPGRVAGGSAEGVTAAMCRKALEAMRRGDHEIEIWGDGTQQRAFTFITDAVEGIERVMRLETPEPVMVSNRESTTINQLVDLIEEIAGVRFQRHYVSDDGAGVARHDLDHDAAEKALGWEPQVKIAEGIEKNYAWIRDHGLHAPESA